jgi:hypothetical protein
MPQNQAERRLKFIVWNCHCNNIRTVKSSYNPPSLTLSATTALCSNPGPDFPSLLSLVHITPSPLVATVLTVSLRLIELLVKPLSPPLDNKAKHNRAKAAEKNESASESVVRLVLGREEIGREPMRALADAVCDGDQSCFLAAGSWHQSRLPRELQVETVVGAADQEASAEVAGADVRGGDHDCDSGGGGDDRDDDVVARFSEFARAPGESAGAGVGDGVGWCLN